MRKPRVETLNYYGRKTSVHAIPGLIATDRFFVGEP